MSAWPLSWSASPANSVEAGFNSVAVEPAFNSVAQPLASGAAWQPNILRNPGGSITSRLRGGGGLDRSSLRPVCGRKPPRLRPVRESPQNAQWLHCFVHRLPSGNLDRKLLYLNVLHDTCTDVEEACYDYLDGVYLLPEESVDEDQG